MDPEFLGKWKIKLSFRLTVQIHNDIWLAQVYGMNRENFIPLK